MIKYTLLIFLLPFAAIAQVQNPSFEQSDSLGNTVHWTLAQGRLTRWSARSFNGIPFTAADRNFFIELQSDTQATVKHAIFGQSFPVSAIDKSVYVNFLLLTADTSVYAGLTYTATKWNGTQRDTITSVTHPIKAVLNGNFIPVQWNNFSANTLATAQADSAHIQITNGLNAPNYKNAVLFIDNLTLKTWPTSIAEINKPNTIQLYPNPASDWLNISGIESATQAKIYDQLGQLIEQYNLSSNHQTIDISNLKNGWYYIQFNNASSSITIPLSIQH